MFGFLKKAITKPFKDVHKAVKGTAKAVGKVSGLKKKDTAVALKGTAPAASVVGGGPSGGRAIDVELNKKLEKNAKAQYAKMTKS